MIHHTTPQMHSFNFVNQGRTPSAFKYGSSMASVAVPPVPAAYLNDDDLMYPSTMYSMDVSPPVRRGTSNKTYYDHGVSHGLFNDGQVSTMTFNSSPLLSSGDWSPPVPSVRAHCSAVEIFARKVFVGGLPIDVDEGEIRRTFEQFGRVIVDWPRRPEGHLDDFMRSSRSMTGYVFLVFEEERSVQLLVNECHREEDKYYLFISSPTMRAKPVQVRPWKLSDMDYMLDATMPLDPRRTVFIGGVPRPTRARELADCLKHLYGSVCYVGIDIDPELKYPKGAARVTFSTTEGFIAAITGRFVHLPHADTRKRVEIKPYVMDEQMCDECQGKRCASNYAPYFCGDVGCMQYFCESCWDILHCSPGARVNHRPLVRLGDQTKVLATPPHHNGHSRPRGSHRNYSRLSQYPGTSYYSHM